MAKADIEVMLRGGVDEYEAKRYRPGEELRGTVTLFPDGDVQCNHLYVYLAWHTEGRGTRYQAKVSEADVFQGTLKGGYPRSYEFNFTVPESPWSYDGHYISIVWEVQVQVDVPWAKDPKHAEPFILAPVSDQ